MQAILKVVGGKNDGREIKLNVPEFYIGRGEKAHLRPSSDLISRMHCVIRLKDGKVEIEDLKSRNGSFVNEKPLTGVYQAKSGDRLRVGRLNFELLIDPIKAGNKKPKVKDVADAAARTVQSPKKPKPVDFEESITDWLSDDEQALSADGFSGETVQFSLDDVGVSVDSLNEKNEAENAELEAKKEAEKLEEQEQSKKKKGKKEFGKLPPRPKFSHDDSTTAAGDVLKKFFNRR